ncbi:hypothetical protein MMPV_006276 [Pyropia vietnamensis]
MAARPHVPSWGWPARRRLSLPVSAGAFLVAALLLSNPVIVDGGAVRVARPAVPVLPGITVRQDAGAAPAAADAAGPASPRTPALVTISPAVATTYIFFTHFWWEMFHNQLTTLTTGLAVAKLFPNSILVLPPAVGVPQPSPAADGATVSHKHVSLLGDYYDLDKLRAVQKVMTLDEFLAAGSATAAAIAAVPTGSLPLPKASQEDYEKELGLLGDIADTRVSIPLPHEDLERTEQYCDSVSGSIYAVPAAGGGPTTAQFVFLDRLHFFHFCTEKFVPWWYDVRLHLQPRSEYFAAADAWRATIKGPLTVVHLRDLMDGQRDRDEEEVQRYARQVVDALRQTTGTGPAAGGSGSGSVGVQADLAAGSLYLSYPSGGKNVGRVAALFREEFPRVYTCADVHQCGAAVTEETLGVAAGGDGAEPDIDSLFLSPHAATVLETALSMSADHFVGNIYSSYSRNVGLWRKMHGRSYTIVKGFGELRRIWTWRL